MRTIAADPSRAGVWIAHKEFALVTLIVDWWIEPLAYHTGFNLYKLPGTPPDFVKADSNPMPAPDAKPDTSALKALLQREYSGFELLASLR